MTQLSHEQIAQRSFMIWEQEGRPSGQALDHWLQAERELSDLFAKKAPLKAKKAKPTAKPATSSSKRTAPAKKAAGKAATTKAGAKAGQKARPAKKT